MYREYIGGEDCGEVFVFLGASTNEK
jgi:hypothetical protein